MKTDKGKIRDVDEIITGITNKYPSVRVEQLKVHHPGMDDDGIWFFEQPNSEYHVQIESSWGTCPFVIETDESNARYRPSSIGETIEILLTLLRLQQANDISQYQWY